MRHLRSDGKTFLRRLEAVSCDDVTTVQDLFLFPLPPILPFGIKRAFLGRTTGRGAGPTRVPPWLHIDQP